MAKVNINVTPYYDDFDESKNYHRILFKPGVAVQARELTQLQTIIYNQIRRFANHIFKDGTVIQRSDPATVQPNESGRTIKLAGTPNVDAFVNTFVTGATSNIIGRVLAVYDADNPTVNDPPTIVVSLKPGYENDGIFSSSETLKFYTNYTQAVAKGTTSLTATTESDLVYTVTGTSDIYTNEITVSSTTGIQVGDYVVNTNFETDLYVTEIISSTKFALNKRPGATIVSSTIFMYRKNTVPSLVVGITEGVYYKNGFFIKVNPQTVVVDKYNRYPNKSVILKYNEEIITSDDDNSLLDPAIGASNFFARGADRLKVSLLADSVDLTSLGTPDYNDDYIELVRYNLGIPTYLLSETEYSEIDNQINKRNYDALGNFFVKDFVLTPYSVNANSTVAVFSVGPGSAFVGGKEVKNPSQLLIGIDKANTTSFLAQTNFSPYYGSYILVQNPGGKAIPEDRILGYYSFEGHNVVKPTSHTSKLYDKMVIKHLQFDRQEGANNVYRAYFHYLQANASIQLDKKLRSLVCVDNQYTLNGYSYSTPLANILVNIQNGTDAKGNVIIFDGSNPGTLVFPLAKPFIKKSEEINFQYVKLFEDVTVSTGAFSATVTSPESFVGGAASTLALSTANTYYYAICRQTSSPYTAGDYIALGTNGMTVSINSAGTTLSVDLDNTYTGKLDLYAMVETDNSNLRQKTLVQNYVHVANLSVQFQANVLPNADIKAFKNIYRIGTSNTYVGAFNSGTTYTSNSLVNNGFLVYRANVTSTGQALSNTTAWEQVIPLQPYLFKLDNGQRPSLYDFGRVEYLGANAVAPGNVLVIYDYFTHSTLSGTGSYLGPITAESYPDYNDIPYFVTENKNYNLRDCLDFRPIRDDTYFSNTTFKTTVVPNPTFTGSESDITYYLGRKDRLYVVNNEASDTNKSEIFLIEKGIPNENPKVNLDNSDSTKQSIAILHVPPYTPDSRTIGIEYTPISRYTMKDIGNLDKKLIQLERMVNRHDIELTGLATRIYDDEGNITLNVSIFTDDFSTTTRADTNSRYFNCVIDTVAKYGEPKFKIVTIPVEETNLADVKKTNSFITNKYNEANIISQLGVSDFVYVNITEAPVDTGRIEIEPAVVYDWYDWNFGGGNGTSASSGDGSST